MSREEKIERILELLEQLEVIPKQQEPRDNREVDQADYP